MKSKITGGETEELFTVEVLNKYKVRYYRCMATGFIQTEDPYWLQEAYSSAITKLDIGLVSRNELLRNKTTRILASFFDGNKRFLDYAGGYGMFTRMMRDQGYDFFHYDLYCQNIFAEYFDLSDSVQKSNFELVTAFEVLEHLASPIEEISKIFALSENVLFSTVLQPTDPKNIMDWWYLTPETGQHIALYTRKSLEFLARQFGRHFLSDGTSLHLFTKEKLSSNPFEEEKEPYLIKTMRRNLNRYDMKLHPPKRESLLSADFDFVREKLK